VRVIRARSNEATDRNGIDLEIFLISDDDVREVEQQSLITLLMRTSKKLNRMLYDIHRVHSHFNVKVTKAKGARRFRVLFEFGKKGSIIEIVQPVKNL